MVYKVGDKVKVMDGRIGTIVEVEQDNMLGEQFLKIDFGHSQLWTWANKLPKQDSACTCGLKFVRDGGIHSDWCDAYITTGGSNESANLSTGFTGWPFW